MRNAEFRLPGPDSATDFTIRNPQSAFLPAHICGIFQHLLFAPAIWL